MRNRHPGPCCICKTTVQANAGHFEKNTPGYPHYDPNAGKWRLRHVYCRYRPTGPRIRNVHEQEG